jgi:hypothetical protein
MIEIILVGSLSAALVVLFLIKLKKTPRRQERWMRHDNPRKVLHSGAFTLWTTNLRGCLLKPQI